MNWSTSRLNLRSTRFLVVEDNPHALDIMAQVLVGFGVSNSHKCDNAEDAFGVVDNQTFDVILADGEMDGQGGGFEFTRHVRAGPGACNFTTPIVIVSGCPTRQKIVEARDCGANYVIAKPIVPGTLLTRIAWIARGDRDFVVADTYRGPDRRFRKVALPSGMEDRRAEAVRLAKSPERDLSQEEIDSLF